MKKLVFATQNLYKAEEVKSLVWPFYEVLHLAAIGCHEDIPETGTTFAENASLKSKYVYENYQLDCFADDSGLEVKALNNEPGIYSARYSGMRGDELNLEFLLRKMEGQSDRRARFRTVISLIVSGKEFFFEGSINGNLLTSPRGDQGFGYDPIFVPDGYEQTFAEMPMSKKNEISHRAIAMAKLIEYLKNQS